MESRLISRLDEGDGGIGGWTRLDNGQNLYVSITPKYVHTHDKNRQNQIQVNLSSTANLTSFPLFIELVTHFHRDSMHQLENHSDTLHATSRMH